MKLYVAALALVAAASAAQAQISEIWDGNSYVRINTGESGHRIGMDRWQVDGVNHLYNQWFWFRVGETGPEQRINSLPEVGRAVADTNPFVDPRPDTFNIRYGSLSTFTTDIRFSVAGGANGSGASDILESITITNWGSTALSFHFFQYCDFDLNDDIVDTSVAINPNNTASQADGNLIVTETVVTPMPSNREVGVYAGTINRLDDGATDVLNGNAGPLAGPTRLDYTWAFQWDFILQPGGSFIISKDKNLIPTPTGAALLGLGGLAAARRRRR